MAAVGRWARSHLHCPECGQRVLRWIGPPRVPGEPMEACTACGWEG